MMCFDAHGLRTAMSSRRSVLASGCVAGIFPTWHSQVCCMSPLRETPLGFLFSKVRGTSAFDLTVGWFVASWISPLVPQLRRNVRQGISLLHPLGLEGGSPLNLLKPLILSPLRGSLPRRKNANHFLPGGLLRFSPRLRIGVTSVFFEEYRPRALFKREGTALALIARRLSEAGFGAERR